MDILTRCYVKDGDLVTRNVAGETIIVPIRSKVGDLGSIYTLNEVGSTIWELIDGKNTVAEITEVVCNTYEVTPELANKDTLEFLDSLAQAGLVRPCGP